MPAIQEGLLYKDFFILQLPVQLIHEVKIYSKCWKLIYKSTPCGIAQKQQIYDHFIQNGTFC